MSLLIQLMTGKKILVIAMCGALFSACSTKHYRKAADKEVAGVIAAKTPNVPNMDTNFTIEVTSSVSLDDLPTFDKTEAYFGADGSIETGARIISLDKALEIAIKHSRTYQNRKELLYLNALSLTLDRHLFTPIFGSRGKANYSSIERGVDTIVEERTISSGETTGVDQLLKFGTQLGVSFTSDFLRFVSGDPSVTSSSKLAGTLSQSLLRGAGHKIATERLTQAERDFLYSLRDFTRFRKEFSVDIASSYYNVLQNRDAVRNSFRGFQDFKDNVARERAFADADLRAKAQLAQLQQAELTTESRWVNAIRSYRQSLDQFKIQLGLPTDAHVILDDAELERLRIVHPTIHLDDAMKVAMVTRLDLETERDQVVDAQRHIGVSGDSFLPQLDLVGGASVQGRENNGFTTPDFQRQSWNAGLNVDLPLNRKAVRNDYRGKLIAYERARRELDLAVDNIKLQIADDWRNLDQAKRNYEISELGVRIASSRVEEQKLRQEYGEARARDLIDAQNDLIDSQNQRTDAVVSHTIARLKFWRDMGILFIQDNGRWEDMNDEEYE